MNTSAVFLLLGALSAAVSVIVGAASTHSPHPAIAAQLPVLQTAVQYQQFHVLGLLLTGLLARRQSGRLLRVAGALMLTGTVLFSGTIYLRVFADIQSFRALVPFGGGAWIAAWLALAAAVWSDRHRGE